MKTLGIGILCLVTMAWLVAGVVRSDLSCTVAGMGTGWIVVQMIGDDGEDE